MSDLEHYDRWDIEEPPDRGSNNVHKWVYTGTNYGDDDPSWNGEGRCYCIECGADGDASCQTMCEPIDVLCQRHRPLPDGQPLILSAAAPNAGAIPRRCPMNNCPRIRERPFLMLTPEIICACIAQFMTTEALLARGR